ncbi:ATP-binding cassette sub-family A member 6 [Myotis davidii]|uniref:ATP-binding cassette sub-family A member 6 n=1 Tax=Myotis davidii TaxID=225400 RepID=L5MH30_MYODS|nr:ATP-binding cassette sub-family A member 6 [Myotis davidii]
MNRKKKNVYQQTQALLCKNFLKKWRMKRESLLEWGFPVLLGLYMGLLSYTKENTQFPGKPSQNLGRVDKYNNSLMFAVYTPVSNITKQIMNKTVSAPFLKVHCWNSGNESSCSLTKYWSSGFVALQAAINAAIIEIALTFLMSVVLKKTSLTNFVVLLLTLFWGGVGLSALHRQLPSSLEWILSIFSPFAFTAGMAQIIHMDYNMNGVTFPDPSGDSYIMIATFFMLAFDAFWYLVLALYFDKILPYGNERRYSPLFFLNSSSCFQHQRTDNIIEKETDLEHTSDDDFEPMAPEFQGKEAIRIRNIKKEYKEKSGKVEALKGLLFDIYEGQITAILGNSGAGKSSLLNILNGLSVATEGSVTIYNKNLSEMQDLEEIRKITGVCPQSNVHFDILTVKENLRLFAKIKGIQPQEVDQEVQRILLELDIQNIQDTPAQHLREAQKRKLTFGIAILGDPKVLLLDEPTAGLDPFSRQQVWSFLKERKAGHVILLSTSFMDEADILADRKVIMSNGRLKCAGSSGFLKRKWGLGYHLSLYRNEICDPERVTSFINHHVPDAKLKTESKEKLVYTLPVERTDKFPGLVIHMPFQMYLLLSIALDLFSDLDKGSVQGVVSYNIAVSTLNEVFKKVEEISTVDQESNIEDFIQSLKHQNILLEIDDFVNRNSPDDLSYNGAIIVAGKQKDYRFSVVCNTKRLQCFPVLMNIISNALLGMFNHTQQIRTLRGLFPLNVFFIWTGLPEGSFFLFSVVCSIAPYIAMSSVSDYKTSSSLLDVIIMSYSLSSASLWSMVFVPSFALYGFLVFMIDRIYEHQRQNEDLFYDLSGTDFLICLIPYFQALLFAFVLRCMEMKCGQTVMRKDPVFRISPQRREARPNPEEPIDEDEDVQAERTRTATALMITSSIEEVELKGWNSIWGDGSVKFLGYCPQENALWPNLTVRVHLDLFAAVKGLRKADAAVAITRLVDAFKLHQELNVPVQKLTPGATRKLCFMLSILGNSPILILDEPSTGVDPTGQQQMWHMIQSTIKNTEKAALLTTQNLVEAETLCDRIAIMVSGRLRCIGSIQHLKSKLGKDYILELKVQEASQRTSVHTEILKLFPQAALQERYSTFLAYKLPVADVHPLSQAFSKLEAVKHNFNLEEYSLSQGTLEKVLVELSKEQTVGNFDEEVDTTMRWKLLSHSEDP